MCRMINQNDKILKKITFVKKHYPWLNFIYKRLNDLLNQ